MLIETLIETPLNSGTPNRRGAPRRRARCPRPTTARKSGTAPLILAGFLVVSLCGLAAGPAAAAEVANRIVLRVNEEILTLYEYEERKANEISMILSNQRLDSTRRQEQLERVGRVVLQNSLSEMMLLSFANQQGIRISDAEVGEAVQELMTRQGIENDDQLRQALASSGMTIEQVRENTYRELLWQQVVGREVQPKVVIGEEELRAYYRTHKDDFLVPEQRWLKEIIVLESSGLEDSELRRLAQEIRGQLAAGGDLESVVEPHEQKEVTTGVIDLDWLRAEELEASLSEAAWALTAGEYSPPVAGRGGYHILHLAGLREAEQKPLAEVQDLIRRREYGKRFNRELRTFLADLENKSYIKENLPPEAVGYRALTSEFQTEDEIELFRAPVLESPDEEATAAEEASGGGR